jgi:hypothetical protein
LEAGLIRNRQGRPRLYLVHALRGPVSSPDLAFSFEEVPDLLYRSMTDGIRDPPYRENCMGQASSRGGRE